MPTVLLFTRWKGLPLSGCAWAPKEKLEEVQGLVEEFDGSNGNKLSGKRKRLIKEDKLEEAKKLKTK
jgi:hypothetical protein